MIRSREQIRKCRRSRKRFVVDKRLLQKGNVKFLDGVRSSRGGTGAMSQEVVWAAPALVRGEATRIARIWIAALSRQSHSRLQ
jgi:hypothetical protein